MSITGQWSGDTLIRQRKETKSEQQFVSSLGETEQSWEISEIQLLVKYQFLISTIGFSICCQIGCSVFFSISLKSHLMYTCAIQLPWSSLDLPGSKLDKDKVQTVHNLEEDWPQHSCYKEIIRLWQTTTLTKSTITSAFVLHFSRYQQKTLHITSRQTHKITDSTISNKTLWVRILQEDTLSHCILSSCTPQYPFFSPRPFLWLWPH